MTQASRATVPAVAAAEVAVQPRHGFLPPVYVIEGCPSRALTDEDWTRIAPIPCWTDLFGERPAQAAADVNVKLAFDAQHLHVRARFIRADPTLRPDIAADSPEFWKQDHLDVRFAPDPTHPGQQAVFIVPWTGRAWDNRGLIPAGGAHWQVQRTGDQWSILGRIAWAALGRGLPAEGEALPGMVALTHFAGEHPTFQAQSAVELGLGQPERQAHWRFAEMNDASAVALERLAWTPAAWISGSPTARLTLVNRADAACVGHWQLWREQGGGASCVAQAAATLPPGATTLEVPLALDRPAYARFTVRWIQDHRTSDLGSVTLCAPAREVIPALWSAHDPGQPRSLLPSMVLDQLRAKAKNPAFAPYIEKLRAKPGEFPGELPGDIPTGQDHAHALAILAFAGQCAQRWVIEPSDRWISLASQAVARCPQHWKPRRHIDLKEGNVCAAVALAYELFRPMLTAGERQTWVKTLELILQLHLETSRQRAWNVTTIANANAVTNGGAGLIALALRQDSPDLACTCLNYAIRHLHLYQDYCYGSDGGCTEGVQYWTYGLTSFLHFVVLLEQLTGWTDGLLDHPSIHLAGNNLRVALCNDGKLHGINDTIPLPVGGELACFLAGRFKDPLGLWYADHAERTLADMERRGLPTTYHADPFWALYYRPDVPEQFDAPALPPTVALHDIEYAIARSQPRWDCPISAGLKGSRPPYTHHNQPDTGAYFIDLHGQRMLVDPGYYKDKPTDHCLPVIDNLSPKQPDAWTGRLGEPAVVGPCRYLTIDATRAFAPAAARFVRHLLIVGDHAVVVLDDIVPAGAGRIDSWLQAGGETSWLTAPTALLIRGQKAKFRCDALGPEELSGELRPERTYQDSHWGYKFAECRWFPVVLQYRAEVARPLVMVYQDATAALPAPAELKLTAQRLDLTLADGSLVRFGRDDRGWHWIPLHAGVRSASV